MLLPKQLFRQVSTLLGEKKNMKRAMESMKVFLELILG